ncbi:MAG TPA: potassium transporter Kup, partial [Geminicoccaceae bacterium]|nr:potassium transporter Kup [Geminicoccaceae bacterium]
MPAPMDASADAGADAGHAQATARPGFWALALGSVGVVYGDIGTSPLYALREALTHAQAGGVTRAEVLGVTSLLLWALIFIVTVKYVLFLMRADNRGEGGTLSLMALAQRSLGRGAVPVFVLGVTGAALFYGDAMITPAISVLSAVEGLKLITPVFDPYVVPITVAILIALFAVQRHGTGKVAALFGPITAAWFVVMAVLGLLHLGDDPGVFAALSPHHAVAFVATHGMVGFVVLGSVFLAVTGAEALYADMGHFGRGPIRAAWIGLVFPALALNYLGQGALVLRQPDALANPFFLMAPGWALLPLVLLATVATVIASQAVITGAFSLTRQAIQLGLLPRTEIQHTSDVHAGQIYLPDVNRWLLVGILFLVFLFQTSSDLASAYGIAVTGTMLVDSALGFIVVWKAWRWPLTFAALFIAPFLFVDTVFLLANLLKVLDGGYVPILIAAGVALAMWTWTRGMRVIFHKTHTGLPLLDLIRQLERSPPTRVPNTAVYLTSDPEVVPTALLHNLKHNMVLHENNIIMNVRTARIPRVDDADRVQIERLSDDFSRVILIFGYMETPNIPKAMVLARRLGLKFDIMRTSFFVGRRTIKPA